MQVKAFDVLPKEGIEIRRKVFVEEQGIQNEFDKVDEIAVHFLVFDDMGAPICTCRVFFDDKKSVYVMGRFAVKKECRGKNVGRLMVERIVEYVRKKGQNELQVHAQCRATPFYEKVGFVPFGDVEEEEGIPHIWMKKEI